MTHSSDTHCHLYLEEYKDDLNSVLQKARENNVSKFLVPGIDLPTSEAAVKLAGKYPGQIYPAAGIHPNYASRVNFDEINKIKNLLDQNSKIIALGEIGLDFYRTWASPEDQKYVLVKMLALSAQFQLPVCLHVRDAEQAIIDILDVWCADLVSRKSTICRNPGVFHSYSGSPIIAEWAIDHHFFFGISGVITYSKNTTLRQRLLEIGLDHLILETDSPYLSPQTMRGKRNEPSNVNIIAEELANLFQIDKSDVIKKTSKNAEILFHWE